MKDVLYALIIIVISLLIMPWFCGLVVVYLEWVDKVLRRWE